MQNLRETMRVGAAVFWLNATYEGAGQILGYTPLHKWARKKLAQSTKALIPVALEEFKKHYPHIARDPHVRYTFYPEKDAKGYIDVMCLGEVGLSFEGATAGLKVGIGRADSVFRMDSAGNLQ